MGPLTVKNQGGWWGVFPLGQLGAFIGAWMSDTPPSESIQSDYLFGGESIGKIVGLEVLKGKSTRHFGKAKV